MPSLGRKEELVKRRKQGGTAGVMPALWLTQKNWVGPYHAPSSLHRRGVQRKGGKTGRSWKGRMGTWGGEMMGGKRKDSNTLRHCPLGAGRKSYGVGGLDRRGGKKKKVGGGKDLRANNLPITLSYLKKERSPELQGGGTKRIRSREHHR